MNDNLTLVPVDASNWRKAAFLTTDPERKCPILEEYITSNAFSLLQCLYEPDWDCRLILAGNQAVGFSFFGYAREEGQHWLCRFMIDVKHQGRGYGKAALPLILEEMRRQYACQDIYLSVSDDNERAIHLYTQLGFRPTQDMDAEERIYILEG